MSVQVIYKNKAKLSGLGVIALFGNEKFQVKNLRSSFSKIEFKEIANCEAFSRVNFGFLALTHIFLTSSQLGSNVLSRFGST